MPGDLAMGDGVIAHAPEGAPVRARRERAVERQDLEPVTAELEFTNYFGPQERDDVGTDGKPEAGVHLFRDGGAANHMTAFEYQHPPAGAREVGGGGQPVVPAADHDRVVSHPAPTIIC